MTYYCQHFICSELLPSFSQSRPTTKLHTWDQAGMPLAAQKSWEMTEGCSLQKKNKAHFVGVVCLFIIFLKLKADCFIECSQHQTELMGPLLALFLRNFASLVSLVSVTTLLLLGYSCTFSIINEYYLWHRSGFMYWKLNGHHVAIMLHLQPVVPVFHLPTKSISDFSNNP